MEKRLNNLKEKDLPLVSIIIPVYNCEKYLNKCYESINNQTYKNIEIVFIDDCSKDNSYNILLEISNKNEKVKILKNDINKGVSATRNIGIESCSGEYIGFCDSDDTFEKDMIFDMMESLINNKADIACCGLKRIDSNDKILNYMWKAEEDLTMDSNQAIKNWLKGKYIGNSVYTKLIRRDLWKEIRFPEGEIFEEAYVIPKLFAKANIIVHTGKFLYNYYVRENSLTNSKFNKNKLIVYEREKYIKDFLLDKGSNFDREFECFCIRQNTALYMGTILSKATLDKETFKFVKNKFKQIFFKGLVNPYISIRDKIVMIEIITHLFELKKRKLQ